MKQPRVISRTYDFGRAFAISDRRMRTFKVVSANDHYVQDADLFPIPFWPVPEHPGEPQVPLSMHVNGSPS
jgi:hypothetical protein